MEKALEGKNKSGRIGYIETYLPGWGRWMINKVHGLG